MHNLQRGTLSGDFLLTRTILDDQGLSDSFIIPLAKISFMCLVTLGFKAFCNL